MTTYSTTIEKTAEPELLFETTDHWVAWLDEHAANLAGVWLRIAKKGSSQKSITITEALDGALCFGWIDSQRKALDDDFYLQKYGPRRPKGHWSKVNVHKVLALEAAGRMRQGGIAEVEAAKADGRWDAAYEAQRSVVVPADLNEALESSATARARFDSLGKTGRYLIILPLLKARSAGRRAALVSATLLKLEEEQAYAITPGSKQAG